MAAKPKNEPWIKLSNNLRLVPLHPRTPCMSETEWKARFVRRLVDTPFGAYINQHGWEGDYLAAANADWPVNCHRSPEEAAVEHGTPPT